jgi:hypothetical protein
MSPTKKIQDLLPAVILVVTEAARREDIEVEAIHLDAWTGIDVFTSTAGAREHLSNTIGLEKEVRSTKVGGALYRRGILAGVQIRVFGRSS